MKYDDITQYVSLRNSLAAEKCQLEQRLAQINQALGHADTPAQPAAPFAAEFATPARRGRKGRGSNTMTLKQAVIQVTSATPLRRKEIVDAVQKIGYRFMSKNPLNILGSVLYGKNPRFKNVDGQYSPM